MHYSQQNNVSQVNNVDNLSIGINASGSAGNRRHRGRRRRRRRGEYNTIYNGPPINTSPQSYNPVNINNVCSQAQLAPNFRSSPVALDSQMINSGLAAYVQHSDYSVGQEFQCGYSNYYSPQNNLVQTNQNTTVQQNPVYYSTLPVFNNQPLFNYGYIVPPSVNTNEYTTYLRNNDGMMAATATGGPVTAFAPIEQNAVVTPVCSASNNGLLWQQSEVYSNYCIPSEINTNITTNLNANPHIVPAANNGCDVVISNYVGGCTCGQHIMEQKQDYDTSSQQQEESSDNIQNYNNMQTSPVQEFDETQLKEGKVEVNINKNSIFY